MKRLVMTAILVLIIRSTEPAAGRDPFREHPELDLPRLNIWKPEPAPIDPPLGIYLVTDTYAGDSVIRVGPVTTYSTETVHETTGSYARVLESVATGAGSAFDGASFNGRASMTDGRAVAGTYYENYVRTDGGFVPVSVVFFQDDSEIARLSRAPEPRPGAPAGPSVQPALVPAVVVGPPPSGAIAPFVDREDPRPVSPGPAPALARLPDRSIEVLRGRRTALSLSGDGVAAWRFRSGEVVAFGPLAGTAGEPFVARWDRLAPPDTTWVVRFVLDYTDGTSRELVIRVAVRAPGLVE
jgi:hypothetical protein